MSADQKALLAAIVADPGDDVARLVYADCLEERGSDPRARFIRLQIEAQRHHPDSRAHADLTSEVSALFEAHWIDWWAEVCAAVGLPVPAAAPETRWGKFAKALGFREVSGAPYTLDVGPPGTDRPGEPVVCRARDFGDPRYRGLGSATFRRGFADALELMPGGYDPPPNEPLPPRWAAVAPLASLVAYDHALGPDGPHLAGLRELVLFGPGPRALAERLRSPHLERLTRLQFGATDPAHGDDEWVAALSAPRVARLHELGLHSADAGAARALARVPGAAALRALRLRSGAEGAEAVAALAGSPLAARLDELVVDHPLTAPLARALGAGWERLRKLSVGGPAAHPDADGGAGPLGLLLAARLPALEELRLRHVALTDELVELVARAPTLKQLRHFACTGPGAAGASLRALRQLAGAFDPARIETVAIHAGGSRPALDELAERLGDKLRLL